MNARTPLGIAGALGVGALTAATVGLASRYQREMRDGQARVDAAQPKTIHTALGDIDYAERGSGEPLLLVHGIFQHAVAALPLFDLSPGRRIIAPCRFGYLGSTMPPDATPALQADAFVLFLDALGIERVDVVSVSAGTTSALQLALRHPDRVRHLAVLSGNLPGATTAVVQPSWARFLNRQLPVWLLKTLAPRTMAYLIGVPKDLRLTADDSRTVDEFLDSIFPITPSIEGIDFDAFVSNADVNGYELEAITVPTLIVHTKDDPLIHVDAAERAAPRIPGARLVSLDTGGHLLLGQNDAIRRLLDDFFAEPTVADRGVAQSQGKVTLRA